MVRGSQPENLSKLEKLPQFSFDFTGDFNRKIVLFWKHKNYKTCETAIYAFHHHSQTHFAHRRFNIAVAFFFFQCNLAVPLYLICPCLFIYFFVLSPFSHCEVFWPVSLWLFMTVCCPFIQSLYLYSFHHRMAGQSVPPAGVNWNLGTFPVEGQNCSSWNLYFNNKQEKFCSQH